MFYFVALCLILFLKIVYVFICFFSLLWVSVAVCGLSLVVASWGYSLVVVRGYGGFFHLMNESWYFFIQSLLIPFPNPPPRLPMTTTILPSVSVSLTFFKIPHISANIQYLLFSVWIMSLNLMSSRFIHVVLIGRISFFYG